MRILIDIGHPAHVHFFKNFIQEMGKRGHEVIVTARDKDVAIGLLKAYDIEYTAAGRARKRRLDLFTEWLGRDWEIYSIAKKFHPDILTGIHNPCVAHAARLTGAKSIIFTDTEFAPIGDLITFPFSNVICTPSCFKKDLGKKQVRYNGYHELAYLHPRYFKHDPSVLSELRLSGNDNFIIIRFVSWSASQDIRQRGFNLTTKRRLVEEIKKYGRILITSESPLPEEFKEYRIALPPEKLHDLLYYATLCITEGATIASECAILGTPAIYLNKLRLGYLEEQEERYGLVYNISGPEAAQKQAVAKAIELLQSDGLKQEWQSRRQKMLQDKIDVTGFMVELAESYGKGLD